jgi:hypothetical protein
LEREFGRLVNHCRAANTSARFSNVNVAQCNARAATVKRTRHFSPNTAFKMIEEIEDESTLNTIAVAAKRGKMPLRQLLLNCQ